MANDRLSNPYPEDVFPTMDLAEATEALRKAGISPDRVFGNWGRIVWNNCHEDILKAVGEYLSRGWLAHTDLYRLVSLHDIDTLLRGEMPGEY